MRTYTKKKELVNALNKKSLWERIVEELKRNYILYILSIPIIVYFVAFCYLPMFGLVVAFKNYSPAKGIFGSEWAAMGGFAHFINYFKSDMFFQTIKNTLVISFMNLAVSFPAPIIFALMLNEIKSTKYKKVIQTVTYLPHFISLVVICGMISRFFRTDGILTALITLFGGEKVNYMLEPGWYRGIYVGSEVWQGFGWGSIIYLSALSSIDQELYEAATLDGAGKWKQTLYVTLPGIAPTIIILFIMQMGRMLSVGYEKTLLLQTDQTINTARVISSYVYEVGLGAHRTVPNALSYSSAIGLFQAIVNIMFLCFANSISRKFTETSLF